LGDRHPAALRSSPAPGHRQVNEPDVELAF
jgi:hypothetical protein